MIADNIPNLLLSNMPIDDLLAFSTRLKTTRRKYVEFGLNGRLILVTRKDAVAKTEFAVKSRCQEVANMMTRSMLDATKISTGV